jgi:hypothetical protein
LFFRAGRGKPLQASAGGGAGAAGGGGAAPTAAASEQEDAFIEGVRRRLFGCRVVFWGFVALVSFAFASAPRLCFRRVFPPPLLIMNRKQVPLSDAQLQLFVMLHADDGDA